jgi:hypothetical protein
MMNQIMSCPHSHHILPRPASGSLHLPSLYLVHQAVSSPSQERLPHKTAAPLPGPAVELTSRPRLLCACQVMDWLGALGSYLGSFLFPGEVKAQVCVHWVIPLGSSGQGWRGETQSEEPDMELEPGWPHITVPWKSTPAQCTQLGLVLEG